jgi:hypothetical protein
VPEILLSLSADHRRQLEEVAARRGLSVEALLLRWAQEDISAEMLVMDEVNAAVAAALSGMRSVTGGESH